MKIDYVLKTVVRETDNNRTSRIAKSSRAYIPVTAPSDDAIPVATPSDNAIPVAAPFVTVIPAATSSDTGILAAAMSTSAGHREHDNEEPQAPSGCGKTCALCIKGIQGSGYTRKRARMHVVRLTCSKSNQHICKTHLVVK